MNGDVHERARMLIANREENSWLASHLESCASCCEFAADAGEAIRALRAITIAAGWDLVSTTQPVIISRS